MMGYSFTKIRKGLARRKPEAQVKATSLRKRRMRDRKRLAKLAAAGFEPPPELQSVPHGKTGRPRLSDDEIILQCHAHALRWRIFEAKKLTRAQHAEAAEPLALLAAVADADEAVAEAQAAAALQKLARSLDSRNSADGLVADGPRAVRLTAAVTRSVECCIGGSDELCAEAYPMRCCGQGMCAACLRSWLRRNGERQDMGYGSGASSVPVDGNAPKGASIDRDRTHGLRDGRRYTKRIQTHHCPLCRHPVESVRRGLVTCG